MIKCKLHIVRLLCQFIHQFGDQKIQMKIMLTHKGIFVVADLANFWTFFIRLSKCQAFFRTNISVFYRNKKGLG